MGLTCTLHALSASDAEYLASGVRERNPSLLRSLELDKAWGGVHYLIAGTGDVGCGEARPEDFLLSGVLFNDVSEHVAVHSADGVAQFAAILRSLSAEQLIERFNPERMNSLNVYGEPWDSSGKAYVSQFLNDFRNFIITAAETNEGVMIVIC